MLRPSTNLLVLFISVSFILMSSCGNNKILESNPPEFYIQRLIDDAYFASARLNGKLIIMETEYCEKDNCENLLNDFGDDIRLLDKRDAFMMGNPDRLEIYGINESAVEVGFTHRVGKERKKEIFILEGQKSRRLVN